VIGRVYRGGRVTGLVRYLYGPGRTGSSVQHADPHLVGSWLGAGPATLAALEPVLIQGGRSVGRLDVEHLVRALEMPLGFPDRPVRDPVWHCTLRNADGDRALSDAESGQVAADVLHRTGLAAAGQDGGCPWIAVRHDEVSIHLVAMLAQEDGRPVRLWNDFLRLREGCLAAERRYGLTVTAPADRTAATHTTRGEREKAARAGQGEAPRDWLRRQVRLATAVAAGSDTEFLDRSRAVAVAVKERRGQAGELTGYAVARPDPASGEAVFYGGGRLAGDLSLPTPGK